VELNVLDYVRSRDRSESMRNRFLVWGLLQALYILDEVILTVFEFTFGSTDSEINWSTIKI
jgi:hypothetical protein